MQDYSKIYSKFHPKRHPQYPKSGAISVWNIFNSKLTKSMEAVEDVCYIKEEKYLQWVLMMKRVSEVLVFDLSTGDVMNKLMGLRELKDNGLEDAKIELIFLSFTKIFKFY